MSTFTVSNNEASQWLVEGLRELANHIEDGLAQHIHMEHYSETSATDKIYHLRLDYRKLGVDGKVLMR